MSELYSLQPRALKTVAEICNPHRFGPYCDAYGLQAGTAFDIELGWDLLDYKNQQSVFGYLKTERPGLVILSLLAQNLAHYNSFELGYGLQIKKPLKSINGNYGRLGNYSSFVEM